MDQNSVLQFQLISGSYLSCLNCSQYKRREQLVNQCYQTLTCILTHVIDRYPVFSSNSCSICSYLTLSSFLLFRTKCRWGSVHSSFSFIRLILTCFQQFFNPRADNCSLTNVSSSSLLPTTNQITGPTPLDQILQPCDLRRPKGLLRRGLTTLSSLKLEPWPWSGLVTRS